MSHDAGWIHEARDVLQDYDVNFFKIKPWRYWFDFLISLVLAYGAGTVFLTATLFSWAQVIAFPLANLMVRLPLPHR